MSLPRKSSLDSDTDSIAVGVYVGGGRQEINHGILCQIDAHDPNRARRQLRIATCSFAPMLARSDSRLEKGFADRDLWSVADSDYSGLMLANLTTLPHFSVSSARSLPNSEGEPV